MTISEECVPVDGKKTNLWWCDRLKVAFAAAFVLLAMLGAAVTPVFIVFDCLLLTVFFAVEYTMNRCPRCGRYLGRGWGMFCSHCGQRIREDRPDT